MSRIKFKVAILLLISVIRDHRLNLFLQTSGIQDHLFIVWFDPTIYIQSFYDVSNSYDNILQNVNYGLYLGKFISNFVIKISQIREKRRIQSVVMNYKILQ